MKKLIYILLFFATSCTKEEIPCNSKCGKLYDVRHFRELQQVRYTYVTECVDTITNVIELNAAQLSNDNGVSYFVERFDFKKIFCE